MAAPILPEKLQRELDYIAGQYSNFIHARKYSEAQSAITALFDKMLDWQEEYCMRFHKGYPLHNIGYALHLQNKYDEALNYFILAYVEDLLSADALEGADATPAGQTLLLGYNFTPAFLEIIKGKVKRLKEQGKMPWKPEEVIRELEDSKIEYKAEIKIEIYKREEISLRQFAIFKSPWEERCFVGGSIGLDFIIKRIAEIVRRLGYDPVVCSDFDESEYIDVYDKCLILLHNCRYAVFDIAEQTGQLIEAVKACDYNVKTLVIWPKNKEKNITQMLRSKIDFQKVKSASYEAIDDWERIIQEFLPRLEHSSTK